MEATASPTTRRRPVNEIAPTPEHRSLGELGHTEADLKRAAATIVVGEGSWPEHIGVIAATLVVENAYRRWEVLYPPTPRYAMFHRRLTRRLPGGRLQVASQPHVEQAHDNPKEQGDADRDKGCCPRRSGRHAHGGSRRRAQLGER